VPTEVPPNFMTSVWNDFSGILFSPDEFETLKVFMANWIQNSGKNLGWISFSLAKETFRIWLKGLAK
jgi:hypothetical protein